MNEDLSSYMPTEAEIDDMISFGDIMLHWEIITPFARIKDHEMENI